MTDDFRRRRPKATAPNTRSGRLRRGRSSIEHLSEEAGRAARRFREEIPAVDAGWEATTHDLDIGGPLITGAVAFRMFLWMLPVTLIGVVGFGLLGDATGGSAQGVAKTAGIKGFAAQSITSATEASSQARWLILAVGLLALVSATRSLVKVLWRSHELAWKAPKRSSPRALASVAAAISLSLVFFAISAAISRLRAESGTLAVGAIVFVIVGWFVLWLLISHLLPHGAASWRSLVPGAVLVALSIEGLRLVTIYYVAGKVNSSSSIYGGLGAAAAMLTWFYLLARVVVAAAVLNATLWQRRQRGVSSSPRRTTGGHASTG
jgi:uncharacterized BrkB/YihY/UPF0761 family membrane protein